MAARENPSAGAKPDKIWRDALRIAVKRPIGEETPKPKRVIDELVVILVYKALSGDVPALKEIGDRLDGKPSQQLEHTGTGGGPLSITWLPS